MINFIKIITMMVCCAISTLSFTQTNDSLQYKQLNISTTLTDYLLVSNLCISNINIGLEICVKNQKSISVNLGLIKSYGPSNGFTIIDWLPILKTHGIKLQIERKYYFKKYKLFEPAILLLWPHIFQYKSQMLQNSGYYFSIHTAFQYTESIREGEHYNQIHNPNDIYTVYRSVNSLNFKIGYNCIKKYGLTLDYAIGFGIKYISSHTPFTGSNYDLDFPWNKLFNKGSGVYPNITHQFKIGWQIGFSKKD